MNDIGRVARKLGESLEDSLAQVPVDIVVMGPDLKENSPAARLRSAVIKASRSYGASIRPEHEGLIAVAEEHLGDGNNLSRLEIQLVTTSDVVVLIPDSAGSLCELGLFTINPDACAKMLVLASNAYPQENTYVADGPLRAARQQLAEVAFVNYSNVDEVLALVRGKIERVRASKLDQAFLGGFGG